MHIKKTNIQDIDEGLYSRQLYDLYLHQSYIFTINSHFNFES